MSDKQKYQADGLRWLHELEVLNHPQVINNIKLNVFVQSKQIKEVELLIYREKKSMLVLIELGWFGRKFKKKQIFEDVHNSLQQLLPSFRFRVTDEPAIMQLAVERVKQALSGGAYEKASIVNVTNDLQSVGSESGQDQKAENIESGTGDLSTDQEEQQESVESILEEISLVDSEDQQKT